MKKIITFWLAVLISLISTAFAAEKTRVLLMVGGHSFETNQFYRIFSENSQIDFQVAEHPKALPLLKPESASKFDAIVLYDMNQKISDEEKTNFLNFLESGKGIVILHHAIANYQNWDEYHKILGGRYYLQKTVVDGVEKARSIYKHGVNFKVNIADKNHPITRGLSDFEIHDETYNLYDVYPETHILLTTDEPTSHKKIGWTNNYKKARVVYIQLGHDHFAYENPNYRELISRSIQWVAGKLN
ncbi:MAG: ThuA domain-containing protein [Verrucomicrobiia bacterium]|jgi:type 1 glutamine amidotransferase